jgi:hypothetical protein
MPRVGFLCPGHKVALDFARETSIVEPLAGLDDHAIAVAAYNKIGSTGERDHAWHLPLGILPPRALR